jgi:phosphoserine phosphatase RsbU/P
MSSIRTIPAGHGPVRVYPGGDQPGEAEPESHTTPTSAWKGYLEIRLNGGTVTRRLLTESHVVIGRIPGVQLLLDHHTVSRRHAEMFCDPFGRWWIRDLASTNGTLVNDEPVSERVLQPADKIAIGDFTLAFYPEPQNEKRSPRSTLPLEDDKPTAIRTLLDFEPPRISAEHLRILMELSRKLIGIEDPRERLKELLTTMIRPDFHASLAVALRVSREGTPILVSRPYRPTAFTPDEQPYISGRVLKTLRETREPVLAGNLISHPAGNGTPVELTMSRDVMALWVVACPLFPLRRDDEEFDVLYVTLPPECGSVEWLSLIALAAEVYGQSEDAWRVRRYAQAHAAIERELETARQIQQGLVPRNIDFKGLDVAVGFEPCKWVGGDYADAVPMADGRLLLAVADVCGKGLQAALVTSSLHTMVRATADSGRTVPQLMERVNKHLCEWLPNHSFVTMVAVAIDPATGEVECVNAGHPPVLIACKNGPVRYLQSAVNPALGMCLTSMESERTRLEPGEVLAMYTDGLTELRNASKEMLGQERLGESFHQICAAEPGQGIDRIAAELTRMLEDFRGDRLPEDDRAFLLARRR